MKARNLFVIILLVLIIPFVLSATLSGHKICVDPGHGGSDPGATGIDGSALPNEADLVLDVDLRLRSKLENDSATVVMTRTDDTTVELANRVAIANDNSVTIFVSTHLNSYSDESAHGTETYAYQSGTNSATLATHIQNELLDYLGRYDRGVKYAGYYVIKYTNMPASLSEGLFVSNTEEFNLISQSSAREDHATAVYRAICQYFGETPQEGGTTTDPGNLKGFVYNATQGDNVEGNRIAGADCYLSQEGTDKYNVVSSSTGLFTFTGAEAGDYELRIEKTGFNTATKDVTIIAGSDTWASTGITEDTGGTATAWLKGFIYNDSTGLGNIAENRIEDAACTLTNTSTSATSTVNSDSTGLFRFNELEPGSYTMKVEKTGFTTKTVNFTIVDGENWGSTAIEEEGAVELGSVTGTITSKTTYSVIDGAQCILTNSSDDPFTVYSDESGKYAFEDMVPGDYSLSIEADGYEKWQGDITINAGQETVKDVQMEVSETADETETPDEETIDNEVTDSETPDESVTDIEETMDENQANPDNLTTDNSIETDDENLPEDEEVGCSMTLI